jgi:hypothetical protein
MDHNSALPDTEMEIEVVSHGRGVCSYTLCRVHEHEDEGAGAMIFATPAAAGL